MADVFIMRATQDYSGLFWSLTSGSVLYSSILEVGPLGPAGGAAEGSELGYDAPGATYTSTAGLNVLL